jgi:hypothetical protein
MKTYRELCRLSLALILALGCSTTMAQAPAAGAAAGTLTVKGKAINLAHAAAFADEKAKQVILLVTEQPVPAANWKSHSDIMMYRMDKKPLRGIAFRLDDKRQVVGADYYDDQFPTSTSGIFELKLEGPVGKTLAGTAKSTAAAANLSEPVTLTVSFNATLK